MQFLSAGAMLGCGSGAENHDPDIGVLGLGVEPFDKSEAVALGHIQVGLNELNGLPVALSLLQSGDRVIDAGRHGRLHAPHGRYFLENESVRFVVIDDEHAQSLQIILLAFVLVGGGFRVQVESCGEAKGGSLADVAFDTDFAVHEFDELLRDCQSQAGAAVFARRRSVCLLKRLEHARLLVLGNADAGIGDGECQDHVVVVPLLGADLDDDLARVRKLDRVADQIDNHLPQPAGVANQMIGNIRLDVAGNLQAFGVATKSQGLDAIAEVVAQNEGDFLEIQFLRLDLREVEDVVDEAQESATRGFDRLQIAALLGAQVGVQGKLGHPDDSVHRRANLVAHVRQEFALGAVGPGRLGLGTFALGDLALEFFGHPQRKELWHLRYYRHDGGHGSKGCDQLDQGG